MRTLVAAIVAATIISSNAFAATGTDTLSPGKPAGVKSAQSEDNTVWYLVGLGVVGAGIGLIASGNSNNSLAPGTLSTNSTNSTSGTQ